MRFPIPLARAALAAAALTLPLKAAGCTGSTACIDVPQAMYAAKGCPSRSAAGTFFAGACAVASVDGEGSYDGEFCCYPVTETGNAVDCGGMAFGGGVGGVGGGPTTAQAGGSGQGGAGGALTAVDCTCACTTLMSAGGCADLCDDMENGNPNTPNWCNGAPALSQCAACLQSQCDIPPDDDGAQTECAGG
jgi:hypothetical protein